MDTNHITSITKYRLAFALEKLHYSAIFLLLILASAIAAQAQHIHFFSSDSHLSSTLIKQVLYDSRGFLWVATEDGLNRFDGSRFNIYRNIEGDSTSLADNYIASIFEDEKHNLLVSTYAGVQVYNPSTDTFSPLDPKSRHQRENYSVGDMTQGPDGKILLGGRYLVESVVTPSRSIRYSNIIHSEPSWMIRKVMVDDAGNIWTISNTHSLTRFSPDGTMKDFSNPASEPQSIAKMTDGSIYVGMDDGRLMMFQPKEDKFVEVARAKAPIAALKPHPTGNLLVGTDGAGLRVYRPGQGFVEVPFIDSSAKSLKIHSIEYDEYGNLWIGAFQKGLVMIPAQSNAFSNLGSRAVQSRLIGDACVTSVFAEDDGTLWVGTDNDGIYKVSPSRFDSKHFADGVPAIIDKFYVDEKGRLWVGSYDKGLGILDRNTGAYKRLDIHDAQGRDVYRVFDMVEDGTGRMFIATMGNGLFVIEGDGKPKPYATTDSYNPWITTLALDPSSGKLFIGTYDGIFEVDGGKMKHLLGAKIINSIVVAEHEPALWVGTTQGLVKINFETGESQQLGNILDRTMIHAVRSDGQNLWLSTNSGLYMYNPPKGDLLNYNYSDGLQGNEFYKGAACEGADGTLYFGGINGVTYFDPRRVQRASAPGDVRITRFYVGGDEIKAGEPASGSKPVTTRAVFETDTFRLAASDVTFSLDFNVRDPFAHASPMFYYSLDGSDWQQMPNQTSTSYSPGNHLSFSHLPSGTHRLSLKAVDKGLESPVRTVMIVVDPAWYATPWAMIIYAAIILLAAGGIWWYWRRRQRNKMVELQRKHEEEVKEGKLQFFTNVSHEIKTPMSLVIGPVEQLIAEDQDPDRQKSYRTILRNSNRILRLVNEIMDLRKIDKSQMHMEYTRVRMVDFVMDLFRTFEPAAKKKDITLIFNHEGCDDLEADVDMANFDKVVMNLLSNALKYTPKGGTVEIDLSLEKNEAAPDGKAADCVRLSVTDTGVGVAKEDREHIFERFYRVADNYATGTGIGLHLASRLMALHNGRLWIEDNPAGQGSRFIAEWPQYTANTQKISKPAAIAEAPKHAVIPLDVDTPESEEGTPQGKRRSPLIYIVEDDKEIASYLAEQLGSNYRTMIFENGQHAMDAMFQQVPDLVISDVMMPVMDGLTLTRKIRDNINFNHTPVLLLTAKTRERDFLEGFEAGADDYIPKPFSVAILRQKVKSLITSHARLRNVYSGQQDQADKVEAPQAVSHDEELLDRVLRVVSANLSNSNITIEMIAQEIGISRVHLHRKLKEITNQTTRDFIRNIRLRKAAELMQSVRLNVAEVADKVGFRNSNSFATVFKEMYGVTPSEYMAQHHKTKQ